MNTKNRQFTLNLVVGGAKQSLVSQLAVNPFSTTVVVDNRNEIIRNKEHYRKLGVLFYELAPNETSYELVNQGDSQVMEAGFATANFATNFGKGARPIFGYLAAQARVQEADFQEMLEQLNERVYLATGGCPENLEVNSYLSYAGATGGGAIVTLENEVTNRLAGMGLAVQSNFHLLGPTTFSGASRRARVIAAATLVHLIATYSVPANEKVVRTLYLSELPPLGKDRATRNRLLHIEQASFQSHRVQAELEVERPNNAATHRLGNFYSRQMDILAEIPTEVLAAQIASELRVEFDHYLKSINPNPAIVRDIYVEDTGRLFGRMELAEVASMFLSESGESLLERVEQPGKAYSMRLFLELEDGSRVELAHLGHELRKEPPSLRRSLDWLSIGLAIQQRLDRELQELDQELAGLERNQQEAEADFQTHLDRFQQKPNRKAAQKSQALFESISAVRGIYDQCRQKREVRATVDRALRDVSALLTMTEQQLSAVSEALDSCLPAMEKPQDRGLVMVPSLEDCFSHVVAVGQMPPEERKIQLAQLAGDLTVSGLGKLLGTDNTNYSEIARLLLEKSPDIDSPPLGGKERLDSPKSFMVLPKLAPEVAEELLVAFRSRDPQCVVAFVNTNRFGVAAVRLAFRQFRDFADLFHGQNLEDLNDAIADPLWRLNFIDAERDLRVLGVTRIDGRLRFR